MSNIKNPTTRSLVLLGLPSLGTAFAVTTLTVYAPTILQNLTGPAITGLIIGIEGIFGLFVPFITGAWADHARTLRGRFNHLIPATVVMAVALLAVGWDGSLWLIIPGIAVFYIGYFAYLAPYWSLYPALIPKSHSGRSRSAEGTWQVVGTFFALLGGGFLFGLWQALPFVLAAGVVVAVTAILGITIILPRASQKVRHSPDKVYDSIRYTFDILRSRPDITRLAVANGLWYAALNSIRAFVVLFFVRGLGYSTGFVSGIIFPVAAIGMAVMSPLSGKLADKYGHRRVLLIALFIYGLGGIVPTLTQSNWVMITVPVFAGAAATVMVLPYSVLMRLMTDERHGASSGIMGVSRGVGSFLGPLLTGVAISLSGHIFPASKGYAALWATISIFVLASIPVFWKIDLKD
ncbi:MAG TPA: MFS transporter [Candidatus Saccharimonadales bacterium]|nr:MFS transporter [Candidatus Saccharimonadales bacterium]